jgi:anti-anti-sigma factor
MVSWARSFEEGGEMTVQMRAIEHGLAISGELDVAAVDDFRRFASMALDGEEEVVLDVADLAFVDTSGISTILRLVETTCPHGLVLRWPRDNVLRVLENLGVEQIQGVRVERR